MKTTLDRTMFYHHLVTGPFVVFADVPDNPDYCYVGDIFTKGPVGGEWKAGDQFMVAHKSMLKPVSEVDPKALSAIEEVRLKIESGTHKIVNTRLVAA